MISGGLFKFHHNQVLTGDLSTRLFFFFWSFLFLSPSLEIQRIIAAALNSSLKCFSPAVGLLSLSFIFVAHAQGSDRGSVSIVEGLCNHFGIC